MTKQVTVIVIAAMVLLAAISALWNGGIPGENLLLKLALQDFRIQRGIWTIDVAQVRHAIRLQVTFWSLVAALAASLWFFRDRLHVNRRPYAFQILMTGGFAVALYMLLLRCGEEAQWYPIERLMKDPASMPIFGHRLLWVWLADAMKAAVPVFSYRQCYFLSQIPPVVLTVYMAGRWSSHFIGYGLQWVGQALVVIMLSMTFGYFTFYDVAIVFFFTLCLDLLKRRRYVWFVIALGVATLNHENAMLLIPVAAFETAARRRLCVSVCLAATVIHFAVRAVLSGLVPFTHHVDWRFWTNLYYPFVNSRGLILSAAQLVFWWGAAALAWRSADPFLKRAALLLPMLGGTTFLVGQFQESRQFDALIPVVVGFLLCLHPQHPALASSSVVHGTAGPHTARAPEAFDVWSSPRGRQ